MSNKIRHSGVVVSAEGGSVKVRILQSSACSACKVASHCHSSETKEKMVEVADGGAQGCYGVGDHVTVVADSSVGFRASLYGYVLPLLLMVATLVAVLASVHDEGMAALAALAVLVPYYLMLYLLRGKLKTQLTFSLEQNDGA